jgi:succinate dehydrogenase/fumarate reductase cytochrome b subunit
MVKPLEGQEPEMMAAAFDLDTVQVLAFTITACFYLLIPFLLVSALTVYAVLPEPSMGQIWLETLRRLVDSVIRVILAYGWSWAARAGCVNQENQDRRC